MNRCWAGVRCLLIVSAGILLLACSQKAVESDMAAEPPPEVEIIEAEPDTTAMEEATRTQEAEDMPPAAPPEEDDWRTSLVELTGADVYFERKSAALTPEAQSILIKKAKWLARYPQIVVVIEGHSDEPGSAEYNLALGARRAGSVKSFLIRMNVDSERLAAVSYGRERPVASGGTEADRQLNRRVHITVERW